MPLTNRQISELLASKGDGEEAGSNKRKALRRAARRAMIWDVEVVEAIQRGRSLTDLPGVGPYISSLILGWCEDGVEPVPPPDLRKAFLTMTEAMGEIEGRLEWTPMGDLQMHTTYSDGLASVEDMARACIQHGYRYAAVTDHGPALKIAGGLSLDAFARQWQEVESINEIMSRDGVDFRLLRSAELNLGLDGAPDVPTGFVDDCDIVLGAFHSKLRLSADQTERYLKALRNGVIDVLAHPVGRIYNFRIGLAADWKVVMTCAAECQVALEIDAYVDRQDLSEEILRIAADHDVFISIGSDAHHPIDLPSLVLGVAAARRAGIASSRILNLMDLDELLLWRNGRRALR